MSFSFAVIVVALALAPPSPFFSASRLTVVVFFPAADVDAAAPFFPAVLVCFVEPFAPVFADVAPFPDARFAVVFPPPPPFPAALAARTADLYGTLAASSLRKC